MHTNHIKLMLLLFLYTAFAQLIAKIDVGHILWWAAIASNIPITYGIFSLVKDDNE